MNIERLVALFLGGGGIVGIISAVFTRITSKEVNEFNLLDRTQKELIRKDEEVIRLTSEKRALEKEVDEKEDLFRHSEFERKRILAELDRVIAQLEETKAEAQMLREKLKKLERGY